MRIGRRFRDAGVALNMTPMIDCCFQLLIFFMLTLQIVAPEGDFNVKMPSAAPTSVMPPGPECVPITVRLTAASDGRLAGICLGQRPLNSFAELRSAVRGICGPDRGPGSRAETAEVELDCDYDLKYEYVISAIDALSGYVADDGRSIVRLVEKIRFAPPR
jgi:biopolymer transport protein ExbD